MSALPFRDTPSRRLFLAALFGYVMLGLAALGPALDGPFLSDDGLFIADNPYVNGEAPLWPVLVPGSPAHVHAGGSYQPVTHLFHALVWRATGGEAGGFHRVNVALHALCAALLVLLFVASSVPPRWALLAGALFTVHPANVEAVAWISQSRTLLATGLVFGALLALERRPLASVALFAAALLSKSIAAFAIPMAAAWVYARRREGRAAPRAALAVGLWLVCLLAFVPFELTGLSTFKPVEARVPADAATTLRTMASIGTHYLVMAATSAGLSAFHEPEPVKSGLDAGWLAGLVLAPLFAWRIAAGLRDGRREAGWWLGAAAAFAPVSQVAPFFFPMADRYLYTLLPGLLGGALLAGRDAARWLETRRPGAGRRVAGAAMVAAALAGVVFGMRANARAALWVSEDLLVLDAARHYPDGMLGHYVAALEALREGDQSAAISHLAESVDRGAYVIRSFATDERLAPLRANPRFQALVRDAAGRRIAFARGIGADDQRSLRSIASGHYLRGELDLAIAALEEALARGGPLQAELEALVARLRRERDAGSAREGR